MIPGGFSGGDEPDGSAKFITAVFRNPGIKDAVTDLMENRDGLMLGICNGFQALIKLGLVPDGKIVDGTEDSPTLTYNKIGRHAVLSGEDRDRVGQVTLAGRRGSGRRIHHPGIPRRRQVHRQRRSAAEAGCQRTDRYSVCGF